MIQAGEAVQLEQRQSRGTRLGQPGVLHHLHRMSFGILVHQHQLDVAGHFGRIDLGHDGVGRGRERGMMKQRQLRRVGERDAVQSVQPEQVQGRFEEADPGQAAQAQPRLGSAHAQHLDRRLAHVRISRHGIHHALRSTRQLDHLADDSGIDLLEPLAPFVERVERTPRQVRQRFDRRVARRAHPDFLGRIERLPGRARKELRVAWAETDDGEAAAAVHFVS
jgi:hypothetical protein